MRRPQPGSGKPVFFDPSGNRWSKVLGAVATLFVVLTVPLVWLLPSAAAPLWAVQQNSSPTYPRELLAQGDPEDVPVVGDEKGIFQRIALAVRKDGHVYLKDPFSDTIFREATLDEASTIGFDHPYVVDNYGVPEDHQLILTFDDGPDPRNTPALLDLLSKEKVPATFFDVGYEMSAFPELVQREVREGHMLANHTLTHASFSDNPDIVNREQLIGNDHLMRGLTGYASRLFRLPEGNPQGNLVGVLQAQQLGYIHVDLDLDTEDWTYAPGEPIPTPKLDGKGHVVLMHDGGGDRQATIHMLQDFITKARAEGYTFTTLAPLLTPQELPQKVTPNADDLATVAVGASLTIVPDIVISWLFWFGIGSLTIMSVLYVILALINNGRQRRKHWEAIPEAQLPFVSVILPVFNEEAVVTKTLDALKASDYPAVEVIAVNDGSTDRTLAILREYARSWPALRVVDQANGGKSAASNNGIAHSRGEVVVTLDGDTIFEPQTIRMFARHFLDPSHKKPLGAVAGHVKVGNQHNLVTAWQALEYISGICVTRMAEGAVGAISIVPGACAAWRREALLRAGGYSHDTMAEDSDLTLTIQSLGYNIVQENKAVAWTEAPMTLKGLAKQRLRWTYGNIQALYKHRRMLLNPRYGVLGLVTMPYALISVLIPLLFMPMTIIVAGIILAQGQWAPIAIFAAFVAGAHLIISTVAVIMVRETPRHLLMVPLYRFIYEPLRAYVLYGSLLQAARGRMVGWYRPERTNSVLLPAPAASQAIRSPQRGLRANGKRAVVPVLSADSAVSRLSADHQ